MGDELHYIVDLGRSIVLNRLVFWKQNRPGVYEFEEDGPKISFVYEIEEAGLFTVEQAEEIVKNDIVKMTCSVSADKVERLFSEFSSF